MIFRPFLHVGNSVCKCIFTPTWFKPKLHTAKTYSQIRNFKQFRGKTKVQETTLQNAFAEKEPIYFSKLWKPFAFTVTFSGTAFIVAAIWEYERIRKRTYKMFNQYKQFGIRRTGWRHKMEVWWNNLTEGEKMFAPICFLNVIVFLAWRIPAFQSTMVRYFYARPASRAVCWPMLLASFSHQSFLHLLGNMYVLHSFCSITVAALGKEQFMALYLTSGVVSGFASNLYKLALGIHSPSLGASGAVMGILGFVSTQFPDTYLAIIFLPMFKFTANMAIKAIVGVDILGCLLRWRVFDHAAHLGGAFFGMFWQAWGNVHIWQKREPILTFWHELRGPPGSL